MALLMVADAFVAILTSCGRVVDGTPEASEASLVDAPLDSSPDVGDATDLRCKNLTGTWIGTMTDTRMDASLAWGVTVYLTMPLPGSSEVGGTVKEDNRPAQPIINGGRYRDNTTDAAVDFGVGRDHPTDGTSRAYGGSLSGVCDSVTGNWFTSDDAGSWELGGPLFLGRQ